MNFAPLTCRDFDLLATQMRGRVFDSSTALAVARRCRHGAPQVLLCRPLKGGLPFPTTLWLTCPWLVKKLGTLESLGGVAQLEEQLRAQPKAWWAYQRRYAALRLSLIPKAQQRFLSRYKPRLWASLVRGGVGGISSPYPTAKCLHLQVGAWLGMGYHPASRWLRGLLPQVEGDDCENLCFRTCAKP